MKNLKNGALKINEKSQVGKTWILNEFGRQYYDNIAYFNFDEQEELVSFFETTKDVKRILQNLTMVNGSPILTGGCYAIHAIHFGNLNLLY